MKIVLAIVVFSVLVLFHELGHFLAAKASGVQVNEFCLGLGPTIIGFTKGETKYSIKLLWFGGACMMEGEDGEECSNPRAFTSVSKLKQGIIVAAGPVFNFILAFVFSVVFIALCGYVKPEVGKALEGYPAYDAGIQQGDVIYSMNGYKPHFFNEISVYLFFHGDEEIEVTYLRDGQKNSAMITPVYSEKDGNYMLGVQSTGIYEKGNAFEVLAYGCYEVKYQIYSTFQSLGMLFTGKVAMKEMSGPVGIVSYVGDVVEESSQDGAFYVFVNLLSITTLLSANLGIMNLLPFPALDGGRLLVIILEAITRKKVPAKIQENINLAGFALLMLFMVAVTVSDVSKFF